MLPTYARRKHAYRYADVAATSTLFSAPPRHSTASRRRQAVSDHNRPHCCSHEPSATSDARPYPDPLSTDFAPCPPMCSTRSVLSLSDVDHDSELRKCSTEIDLTVRVFPANNQTLCRAEARWGCSSLLLTVRARLAAMHLLVLAMYLSLHRWWAVCTRLRPRRQHARAKAAETRAASCELH
jgi:hypothetical protein